MHLFAAKPGGFVDDEGIVDLAQTPGDLVILSAADSTLSALAQAADRLPEDYPSLRLANWMNLVKPAAFDLYQDQVLEQAKVVVVSLLGGARYWEYGHEQLLAWAEADPTRQLILVPGCDAPDYELLTGSTVTPEAAERVWHYLRQGGEDNAEQLLRHLADQWLGWHSDWQAPRTLPHCLIYRPGGREQTLAEWQAQQAPERPVALILFYRSHFQGANTAVVDALLAALEQQGLAPLAAAITSLKEDHCRAEVNALLEQTDAAVVLNTTGFAINRVPARELGNTLGEEAAVLAGQPAVLQVILASSSAEDWEEQPGGLRSRDVAMQVVLPEMDGRVITRAVGFKTEDRYSERCQAPVIRHAPQPDRVAFVAALARRFCALRRKPNHEKRLALVLANYPTSEGRLGNGVGLDTPESTVRILHALAEAGYPLADMPADGAELIAALQGAVTNDTDTRPLRPCWQSLDLATYRHWFDQLPAENRAAVLRRWGEPEADPACRQGRLMLSGIRLGETFVGIQPARGYDIDLVTSYHDADLVPPHNYLAFYFWLRHEYGIDAVIHVGKHGNLEWLPGKGTALSAQCWPDIILGPLPHFYPFIVNDPGEGAQAKRRAQAVIIDHLMPPMTRAESYGDLAELEGLVDEYYQAVGMDPRREEWLRTAIFEQLRRTGLDRELTGIEDPASADEATLLNELDAYLCDIKEAQIRQGLHILGALPETERLADTLVALLRLPRGQAPEQQGLLHNLAHDLHLTDADGNAFNPLDAGATPWQGARPVRLAAQDRSLWRTAADTRERLELLARQLMLDHVLADGDLAALAAELPATARLCRFARQTLLPVLQQSATLELQSLLDGLAGRFVLPGPSGAPSRGRLDTLPTGRNFYTVDSRAIPSPAAWALGQQSARALIERHLQDHGDFPQRLGLSVWGTATMRTGGDDIAQALALMGVRPIWAPGSNRVMDIEVVPSMLLDYPRVDVTLRVSGFFRDAFPNVIRLYDQAVQALAEYEEPGTGNLIRTHVQARQAELQEEGLSAQAAFRQASYRVFGSRPGTYGTGLNNQLDSRRWQTRDDLANTWLGTGHHAYGQTPGDGVPARADLEYQMTRLDAVLQNQDNREHDILDSDPYFQFQGGMAAAVQALSGRQPTIYHADHANPASPRIRTLKEELNRVIRSRVLNPKWIHAMHEHGYKGAFEMAVTVDLLFGYDATTGLVDDHQYAQVTDALALDPDNQAFMRQANPKALEDMAERLLEAAQRGLWQNPGAHADALRDLLLELDAEAEGATDQKQPSPRFQPTGTDS
ncbi:cobaltochelatase subunit CobN [Natronospirillum operosum]|uniref:Cobaltochelatase subunit CobN n=1 Tax=Natronospirillum operosum TaxID=2759953 RepID=A0A4Z0WEI6_9GAMM|nr:cobaltochelatase subunit CobN [Natronospirillum operosum]TGG93872.1 cobaltochelatase subunit CobN [Natronospirillum operosum]